MSLDELLYAVYERVRKNNERFDEIKPLILEAKNIEVYEYYTKDINPKLKSYIENTYFQEYEKMIKVMGLLTCMK